MPDATLLAKQRILDPTYFTLLRGVPIFREHEIIRRDKKTGKVVSRVEVNRAKLKEIAEVNNRREADSGDMAPVTIGHTRKDDKGRPLPAQSQPPVIAYARNFRVGEFGPKKIPAILADFYIEKGKEQELNKYPRRSPEFWDGENFFDPIALLGAQTPQLDLGLVFYSRPADGRIYAKAEGDMPTDLESTATDTDLPATSAGVAEEEGDESAQHEQYMKHCYGHPYAKAYHEAMVKKYAMPEDGTQAGEPDNPPPMEQESPMPYAKNAAVNVQIAQLAASQEKVLKQLKALTDENKALRDQSLHYSRKANESDVEGRLATLARDRYEFDAEVEIKRMLPMTEQQRNDHIAYMRKTHRHDDEPTGGFAVPTSREQIGSDRDDGWKEVDGAPGTKHAEAALQYMRTSEGKREVGDDWPKALKVVLEKKKAGTLASVR